jgi:cell division septation protein DedD
MTDEYSREQRLRKQAEIQSLYTNLTSLREREASYIQFSTVIPGQVKNQIAETRQKIGTTETEIVALGDPSFDTPAHQFYRDGMEAETVGNIDEALRLYKNAARYNHPDANAAVRSLRYRMKTQSLKAGGSAAVAGLSPKILFWLGAAGIIIILMATFVWSQSFTKSPLVAATEFTDTPTPTEIVIIPNTATSTATHTPTSTVTPTPTNTLEPTATEIPVTNTPTPAPTLKPAPKIVGPKNGLVWKDGAVVFEFENANLFFNELYCLNSMKGYDKNNTENWSHPAIGRKQPSIPVEASVFQIARTQGIECIIWTAAIGVDSCDNIISEKTPVRVIGLPRVCKID